MIKRGKMTEYALAYFWLLPALINFCSGTVSRLIGSIGSSLATLTLYGLLIFVVVNGYNKGILRVMRFDLLFALFAAISIIGTYTLYPQNERYLDYSLANWPFAILFYVVGKSIECIDLKHIHNASVIGLCSMFFGYFAFKGQTDKDMTFAYSSLPYVIGIIHGFFGKKQMWYKVFMPIGIFFLFLLGTRGPLVIGLAYFVYCFIKSKHTIRRIILCLLGFSAVIYFVESNEYMQLLTQLNEFLKSYGIESYILKNAIAGSTASVDSRIEFSTQIFNMLKDDLFSLHGLCGDRVVLNGSYSHNFISEFLYTYGVFGGSVLIVCGGLGLFSLYSHLATKDGKDLLVMVLFAFAFKLLFSGSFVSDIWLYFAIGIVSRLNC